MAEKEKKQEKEKYEVTEIATETTRVIKDLDNGDILDIQVALKKVLNNQEKIMKAIL